MKHSFAVLDHTSILKIKNVEIEFDYEQMSFFRTLWERSRYDDFDEWLREYIIVEGVGMLLNAITGLRYPDEF